jgi:putative membrane protein
MLALLKAIHIIFVVTWFAGLFYLPRLFIYHSQTTDPTARAQFTTMETKLYRIIMRPSMLLTVVLGVSLLAWQWSYLSATVWIWVKLSGVVVLLGYHHYCGSLIRKFVNAKSPEDHPVGERFLRIFNEVPALLLIIIVILAVTKPF